MTPLQAMKQALEALDNYCKFGAMLRPIDATEDLRTAIEEMEKEVPVAKAQFEYISGGVKELGDFRPLQHHPAMIPKGWQLVPMEPTVEMITAFDKSLDDAVDGKATGYEDQYGGHFPYYWKAMLDAAPKPEDI